MMARELKDSDTTLNMSVLHYASQWQHEDDMGGHFRCCVIGGSALHVVFLLPVALGLIHLGML